MVTMMMRRPSLMQAEGGEAKVQNKRNYSYGKNSRKRSEYKTEDEEEKKGSYGKVCVCTLLGAEPLCPALAGERCPDDTSLPLFVTTGAPFCPTITAQEGRL